MSFNEQCPYHILSIQTHVQAGVHMQTIVYIMCVCVRARLCLCVGGCVGVCLRVYMCTYVRGVCACECA